MSAMINDPKAYFSQWLPKRSQLLMDLEKEAQSEQIPIVGPVAGQLLYLLARLSQAARILELGTATGYSAILLGNACRMVNGNVVTFEIDPAMAEKARANITKAGLAELVEIRCENALQAIRKQQDAVDMIFLDVEKADYIRVLPECERLLETGGLLVADNTGFKDADAFNQAIAEGEQWESINLWTFLPFHSPENDGMCIALRK